MYKPLEKVQNKIIDLSENEELDIDLAFKLVKWIEQIDNHIKELEINQDRLKDELDFWQDKRFTTPGEK